MITISQKEQNWTSRDLVLLSEWLIKQELYGYALLCLLGPSLGIKVGQLLKKRWEDIITSYDECVEFFSSEEPYINEKELSFFIQRKVSNIYQLMNAPNHNDFLFMNLKTQKVLSTATLNRELKKIQTEYFNFLKDATGHKPNLVELKSNAFEIAWGIDLVEKYGRNKKAFIAVSKRLGHRQLKDTIKLLDRSVIETVDEAINMVDLSIAEEMQIQTAFESPENLKTYFQNHYKPQVSLDFYSPEEVKNITEEMSPEEIEELKNLTKEEE